MNQKGFTRRNTLCQTVKKVSGIAAASVMVSAAGAMSALVSSTMQYSAYPPPATRAQT